MNEDNDNDPERDPSVPLGVKKINDMGVFSVTAIFSIWAYVWTFIVLQDQNVSPAEAWITFLQFFLLLILSWGADRYKSRNDAKQTNVSDLTIEEGENFIEYTAV